MKWIRDLSISYKVLIPPLIMLMALGCILFLLIRGFDRQEQVIGNVHDIALERTGLLNRFMVVSERVQSDLFLVAVLRFMKVPEEEIATVHDHLDQGLQRMEILYGRISHNWPLEAHERGLLNEMKIPLNTFVKEAGQATDAVSQNPSFGILLVRSAAAPFDRFRQALGRFLAYQEAKIAQAQNSSRQTVQGLKTATLTIAGLAAVVAILVTVFIGGWFISRPVRAMTGVMERLEQGDLSPNSTFRNRGDEIGEMAAAVEVFRKNALEKRAAEEALRVSEKNYRTIFDSASDAIFIQDPKNGRILDVNRQMCRMFGYTVAETLNVAVESLSEGVVPYSRKEAMEWIRKAASGVPQIFEWKARKKDGGLFWVEVNLNCITLQNEPRLLAVVRDITERKQAYDALEEKVQERTAELKEANRRLQRLFQSQKMEALGKLVAGVAHEINNPINQVLLNIPLLQRFWADVEPVLKAQAKKAPEREYGGLTYHFLKENMPQLLDYTHLAATRVAEIVKDLKGFSRQSMVAETGTVQINKAVQNALRLTGSTLRKSSVRRVVETADGLPPITANLRNLEQILVNLLLNAAQAVDHDHGEIRISTGRSEDQNRVWFSVCDNGRGIDPDLRESLFDPFVSDRHAEGGTGLGLAVTYSLVKAHGGEISFRSEKGKGTCFEVSFPILRRTGERTATR